MRNLAGYLFSKLGTDDKFYTDKDYTLRLMKYEEGFNELTNHNEENFSKEVIDDIILLTHRDENGSIYIGASTLEDSDVMVFTTKDNFPELKIYPGEGIDIWSYEDKDYIENKDKELVRRHEYLSNRIYYKVKDLYKSEIGVLDTQKLVDQDILPALVKVNYKEDKVLVIDKENTIRLYTLDLDFVKDVSQELIHSDELAEYYNNKDYFFSYTSYNTDLLTITFKKRFISDPLSDNTVATFIYSIDKSMILSKLPEKAYINKITNVDGGNYKNMMAWVTVFNGGMSDDDKKAIEEDTPFAMEIFNEKYMNSVVNGLIPIYNTKLEDNWFDSNFIVISNNINDIGDIIEGIDEFYIVAASDKEEYNYLYRFFFIEDNKIKYEDVYSDTLPKKIFVSRRAGILTFEYHLDGFDNVVSYWQDYGDIIKYSKILIKARGLDNMRKVVEDIDNHLITINDNESCYEDEKSKLLNIIDNKEYFEDKNIFELSCEHLCNLTTNDIDVNMIKMQYGSDPRFMMYFNANRELELRRRTLINESLDDFYKDENKKLSDMAKYAEEQKKKLNL